MNQFASIQRLTDHLRRIEMEILAIRRELKTLPQQQNQASSTEITIPYIWVNKLALKGQMRSLFRTLSIQGEPIGAELLQEQMREAELTVNELSQSIIAAREV